MDDENGGGVGEDIARGMLFWVTKKVVSITSLSINGKTGRPLLKSMHYHQLLPIFKPREGEDVNGFYFLGVF